MIRASAKNHAYVTIMTDPSDYAELLGELRAEGTVGYPFRQRMAQKAFARTAAYDAAISNWLAEDLKITAPRRFIATGVFFSISSTAACETNRLPVRFTLRVRSQFA